jgi:hypothetical protein
VLALRHAPGVVDDEARKDQRAHRAHDHLVYISDKTLNKQE